VSRQPATDDGWLAERSVRAVADELDVAPNTPMRAIRRPRAVGVVEATPRRGINGCFDRDTYCFIVPTDVLMVGPVDPSTIDPDHEPQASAVPSKPRQSPLTVEQLLQLLPQG